MNEINVEVVSIDITKVTNSKLLNGIVLIWLVYVREENYISH